MTEIPAGLTDNRRRASKSGLRLSPAHAGAIPSRSDGTWPTARPIASPRSAAIPLVLFLIAASIFLPEQFSFFVLGLRLTATRLIFILLTPALVIQLGKKIATGRYRFVVSDAAVLLTGFWMVYAPTAIDGFLPALNHAGPIVLEFCVGYYSTRLFLSEHGQALAFAGVLCCLIGVVAVLALLDPLTDHFFVHDLARQLTGYGPPVQVERRFGLLRAAGTLEHPILLGYTCTIGLLIGISVPIRFRFAAASACGLGVLIALSSAPFQASLLGLALLGYSKISRRVPFRWFGLIGLGAAGLGAAFLVSDAPWGFIVSHLIYDPQSGYYRIWTWSQVIEAVAKSPWLGRGFGPWFDIASHSFDSLWLVTAMTSGLPGAALLALSMLGAAVLPTRGANVQLTPAESNLGTTLGILIFLTIFVTFTVHVWGTDWVLIGLLLGVRAHLGELGDIRSFSSRARPGDVFAAAGVSR